jgi:hypothetical protein
MLLQMCPWIRDVLSDWVHTCLLQSIRGRWANPQIRMADAAGNPVGQLPSHAMVEWLQHAERAGSDDPGFTSTQESCVLWLATASNRRVEAVMMMMKVKFYRLSTAIRDLLKQGSG